MEIVIEGKGASIILVVDTVLLNAVSSGDGVFWTKHEIIEQTLPYSAERECGEGIVLEIEYCDHALNGYVRAFRGNGRCARCCIGIWGRRECGESEEIIVFDVEIKGSEDEG